MSGLLLALALAEAGPHPTASRNWVLDVRVTRGLSEISQISYEGGASYAAQEHHLGLGLSGGVRVAEPLSIVYFLDTVVRFHGRGWGFMTGPAMRLDRVIPLSIDLGLGGAAYTTSLPDRNNDNVFPAGVGLASHLTFPVIQLRQSREGRPAGFGLGLAATLALQFFTGGTFVASADIGIVLTL